MAVSYEVRGLENSASLMDVAGGAVVIHDAMDVRRLRLITGLILLSYLTTHLLNHALGLISLGAMEAGRYGVLVLWRNPLSTAALYGSLLTHFGLALWAVYQRHQWRMRMGEALQLTLGLCIPLLLAVHFVGTRMAHEWYGVEDSYAKIVLTLWYNSPIHGIRQSVLIVIAWIHGCLGFHFWLRLRPWYPRWAPCFFVVALLTPVLGLLGFAAGGREIEFTIAHDPSWLERTQQAARSLKPGQGYDLASLLDWILYVFWGCLLFVFAARIIRAQIQRRHRIRIKFPSGQEIAVPRGFSVLDASRFGGIPHASVCGGRGRCSTCRVRIASPLPVLPSPSPAEQRVLLRVGAPPNVRLACQLRPENDLAVIPLLPPGASARDGFAQPAYLSGQERVIAILFADIRSFTTIAERKLPYDLVFLLNSYFQAVGDAIAESGGVVDKFVGDGVMALFGLESSPAQGCRHALQAASAMLAKVSELSEKLTEEIPEPLRIGIGIHCGAAVVGRMGYGTNQQVTAIGDTVNVASRLQDATKEFRCRLVISAELARQAGLEVNGLAQHELMVRNRQEPLAVFAIDDLAALKAVLARSP